MENKTHKRTKKGKTDGADKKKSKKRKEKKKEAEEGCGGEFGCGEGKWSSSCKIRKYVKEQEKVVMGLGWEGSVVLINQDLR